MEWIRKIIKSRKKEEYHVNADQQKKRRTNKFHPKNGSSSQLQRAGEQSCG